jgi:hypothetical protein
LTCGDRISASHKLLFFYSLSKDSIALSFIFAIVLVSIVSSAYSTTKLSFPAQVTAVVPLLSVVGGNKPRIAQITRILCLLISEIRVICG